MKNKTSKVFLALAIVIFIAALVFMILQFVLNFEFLLHPALNFLLIIFGGFGLVNIIYGIIKKNPVNFFGAGIMLALVALYVLWVTYKWWIGVIAMVVVAVIFGLISYLIVGNKTESIAKNDKDDYKDYKTRKAEEQEKKELEEKEEEKKLPEIKSFK